MSDKELLELAAKAVGLHVKAYRLDKDDKFTHLVVGQKFTREKIDWNPLTDDGDALRLAVELMSFNPYKSRGFLPCISTDVIETRRAIVRAAAEIGKSMQP